MKQLTVGVLALSILAWAVGRSPDAPDSSRRDSGPGNQVVRAQFERWAMHALLAPLIDFEMDALAWRAPAPILGCGPAARVRVDGRPLREGASWSARAVRVAWESIGCRPFGADGVELNGQVELNVFMDEEGLSALVEPHGLRVTRLDGAEAVLTRPFTAWLPLVAP